jgi:hypothetical protein
MSKITLKHLIASVVLLTLSVVAAGLAVYKIMADSKTLNEQVTVLAAEQAQENSYYRLQKINEDSKEEREALSKYFLTQSSDSIDFLNQVESLAPQAGVDLQTDKLEDIADKKTGTKWISVQFSFSGTQSDVERFVQILERLPYFSQVTAVSLKARSLDNWQAQVTMRVFISTS